MQIIKKIRTMQIIKNIRMQIIATMVAGGGCVEANRPADCHLRRLPQQQDPQEAVRRRRRTTTMAVVMEKKKMMVVVVVVSRISKNTI